MDADWGEPMTGYKYDSLKPLLDDQGIESSMSADGRSVDYDMSNWRECYRHEISLMDSQARFVNLVPKEIGQMTITDPWIKVEADLLTKGRVIINRSPRYWNDSFPWKDVVNLFGERVLFIGQKSEHADFCQRFGNVLHVRIGRKRGRVLVNVRPSLDGLHLLEEGVVPRLPTICHT